MNKAVLISEEENHITEIDLDIFSDRNKIFSILKGPATFIGQWPEIQVVIMKCRESPFDLLTNRNTLPYPFDKDIGVVVGPILLVRMNANAEPEDFTLDEYRQFEEQTHRSQHQAPLSHT